MYVTADYAQSLRAIGQALETLNIESFEMEPVDENYYVRGVKGVGSSDVEHHRVSVDNLRSIWGPVAEEKIGLGTGERSKNTSLTSKIEVVYTREDVERLEVEGRAKRGDSKKMADSASLSQLLRCIGSYLTQKVARLVKVSWQGDTLTVEYETSMGSRNQETLAPSDLYDFGIRMYLQRASRMNP